MPNNIRCKLSKLKHKGLLNPEEYKTLVDKLEGHDKALRGSGEWIRKYVDDMAIYVCNKCQRASVESSKFCPWCGREREK